MFTNRFIRPRTYARNKHLTPEVSLRAKRLLHTAALEENSAVVVHDIPMAYYKRNVFGRQCTCNIERIEKDVIEKASDILSLNDFILDVPKLFPTQNNCPICYDTGFVGGYERWNCFTLTLDSTLTNTRDLLYESTRPYVFRCSDKDNAIVWNVDIPKYFEQVLDVVICWEEEPAHWNLKIDSTNFTVGVLEASQNDNVDIVLTMRDTDNPKAGLYCIFLVFELSDSLISGDFPNLTKSLTADFNVMDELAAITVNIDNKVTSIATSDVLLDMRHNRLWRITEYEENNPYGSPIDWRLQCRPVKGFEKNLFVPNKNLLQNYNPQNYTYII